jgi:hypothetical protein
MRLIISIPEAQNALRLWQEGVLCNLRRLAGRFKGIATTGSGVPEPSAIQAGESAFLPAYLTGEANAAVIAAALGTDCVRAERSHPAESQARGIENSENPQSRHT